MLQQMIEHLQKTTEESLRPQTFKVAGDPPDLNRTIGKDGTVTVHKAEPHPRNIHCQELAELLGIAKNFPGDHAAIFYSSSQVEFVFDTQNARDRAVCPLIFSEEGQFFWEAYKHRGATYSTDMLKHALRYALRECFTDERLLAQVASVGFGKSDALAQDGGRTGESLGQTITTKVDKPEELPSEHQTFQARMWSNAEMKARGPIRFILDPDTVKREWIVWVAEESMGAFGNYHLGLLHAHLAEGTKNMGLDIPILGGTFVQGRG